MALYQSTFRWFASLVCTTLAVVHQPQAGSTISITACNEYYLPFIASRHTMARSRSLAICFLISFMFSFLLICLDSSNAAMGYYLLLATGYSCLSCVRPALGQIYLSRLFGLALATMKAGCV